MRSTLHTDKGDEMAQPTRSPRIPPVPEAERTGQVRALLDQTRVGTGADANIFATLVRAPGLFRRWLPFGGKLLAGKLPARDREMLILRTGWNCRAEYEWAQHARIALGCGLTADEIGRIAHDPVDDGWSPPDATLLQAADELHVSSTLSDATWSALAGRYDTEQLVELPMLVGHYHLVAMTLNALGVELDDGLDGFPP
jgi:4-carboxymuconolactone decarboxylase